MVAAGLAIAALALLSAALWIFGLDGPDPRLPSPERAESPVASAGCFGCLLASEAGDDYLRRHLERECQA